LPVQTNPSFKDERLLFLPPPLFPNNKKKELLIPAVAHRTRSTAAVYSQGRAERPSNYHFKLFSQQVFFFAPTLFLEVATLSKYWT
jgi:hypothetical protein